MKPDDHLTNDDPIAPSDAFESPHEEHIVKTNPLATNEEDYSVFNEAHTPGATYDVHEAHHGPDTEPPVPMTLGSSVAAERFRPVPIWVIAGSAALLLWAGLYLGSYSGGFQADVFNEVASYKPTGPTGPVDPIVASKKRGHGVFLANCAQCHQADGNGQAGQFPPLVASEWVVGDAPKRLPLILLHGIQGTIHVKGAEYNNQMPAWAGVLSDKQISDVLTYIRGELGGNGAGPIPEAAIKVARDLTIKHDNSYTEAELQQTPPGPIEGDTPAVAPGTAPGAPSAPNGINPPVTSPGTVKPQTAPMGTGPAPAPSPGT